MSEAKPRISREVRELLAEAVSDPKSQLLTIPTIDSARALRKLERPLEARPNFESSLDRLLVERYREEVAELLYRASCEILREIPVVDGRILWETRAPTAHQTLHRAKLLRRCPRAECEELEVLTNHYSGAQPLTAYSLARACHALVPDNVPRVLIALCLIQEEKLLEASKHLTSVLACTPSAFDLSLTLVNLAHIEHRQGAATSSRDLYKRACTDGDALGNAYCEWFTASLRIGDRREAVEAAAQLQDHVSPSCPIALGCLSTLEADICAGRWTLSSAGEDLAQSIARKLPPTAKEIADVIAKCSA